MFAFGYCSAQRRVTSGSRSARHGMAWHEMPDGYLDTMQRTALGEMAITMYTGPLTGVFDQSFIH